MSARADDDPHYVQEAADEKQIPKVVFDIFYVGSDQLAAKYKLKGGYFSIREKTPVTKAERLQDLGPGDAVRKQGDG